MSITPKFSAASRPLSSEERARIAAAYGVEGVPDEVTVVPRGVCAEALPEFDGTRLVFGKGALARTRKVLPRRLRKKHKE